jgi:hypothetical protein
VKTIYFHGLFIQHKLFRLNRAYMSNNLSGITYTSNLNNLDGLSIVQADEIFVDGQSIDPNAFVKKSGDTMSGTLNMGANPVKSSYAPLVDADLANRRYVLDSVIAGSTDILAILSAGYVPYSSASNDTNLGAKNIQTTHVPSAAADLTNKTYVDGQDALKVSKSGDTMTGTLTVPNITATALTTAAPSYTLGINGSNQIVKYANPSSSFSGNVDINYLPFASANNVFADSLISQLYGSAININGTTTVSDGMAVNLGSSFYTGINYVTTAALTTTGLTAAAITPATISYSVPYYAIASNPSSTTQTATCWSYTSTTTSVRWFFTFGYFNFVSVPGATAPTVAVYQANTANTASVLISSTYNIPISVGSDTTAFSGYFTPNLVSGYSGQIYFYFNGLRSNTFRYKSFSIGTSATTVQGSQTIVGIVDFPANGNLLGSPTTTDIPSPGTRLTLWPGSSTAMPYSIGMEAYGLWFASNRDFKWYSGGTTSTLQMTLKNGDLGLGVTPACRFHAYSTSGAEIRCATDSTNNAFVSMRAASASTGGGYILFNGSTQDMEIGNLTNGTTLFLTKDGTMYHVYSTNGGVTDFTQNWDKGTNVYACKALQVQGDAFGATAGCYWFMNNFARTVDGGAKCATMRNDNGNMRLQAGGEQGITIQTDGHTYVTHKMTVDNASGVGAQNGVLNIRLPSGGYTHFGWTDNNNYIRGTNTIVDSTLTLSNVSSTNWIYSYPLVRGADNMARRGQCSCTSVYTNNLVNWGGGINIVQAFYRDNAYTSVNIRGKFSYYTSSVTLAYPTIRVYCQNSGASLYYTQWAFQNVTYAHTVYPFDIVINNAIHPVAGWYDIYIYNGGNCITDGNDCLECSVSVSCAGAY